jgi:hypothetical protein
MAAKAEEVAACHPVKAALEPSVREAIGLARERLGGDSVDGHHERFNRAKWPDVIDSLPTHCVEEGRISRGDLFALGAERDTDGALWSLFCASYLWGQGTAGYGPTRFGWIRRETSKQQLTDLITLAVHEGEAEGPLAAYDRLRGKNIGAAIKYWGPGFFTKLLYAALRDIPSSRPALILDSVMAGRLQALSGLGGFLDKMDRGINWSTHQYAVYLAWMGQTAQHFEVAPELLEFSLFKQAQ